MPKINPEKAILAEPYSVGRRVTVFYHPDDRADACLKNGAGWLAYGLLVAGLLVVVASRMVLSWLREFGVIGQG